MQNPREMTIGSRRHEKTARKKGNLPIEMLKNWGYWHIFLDFFSKTGNVNKKILKLIWYIPN